MSDPTAPYQKHILVCTNERPAGSSRVSCGHCGGAGIRLRFAELLKEHGLKGQVRASKTGCLDVCELGPVVVVYPQDLWYVGVQAEDVEEIFQTSVLKDGIVERLAAGPAEWEKLRQLRTKA
ncbi:ferredoxin [bacterium (Candidatus Blackallbacteria) CG17_big_fil_post_rev_8_21_14_2_50_48_46]|uniref:Ferredoxin n=1 Tax=bacterium (Candidatus Blackallbacteria) CG17_big_fil_post_rev_8_21_14_2_50_48_46 TaxID=2014261 RepID=A0A2M7G7J7_9BACT|nr:MAG: ferredoxin [bacterium (Candidatus Blackallbacteria) CG18_big_fil_WC_8_21_14_2_50_49_26]PIW17699.1 MAG: ferredoxin [bacterium (Candidatus Blackallbacteria) CG17_big_fil_post_rev_8_21_14_2_50_48_46]PIW47515.1 MAG: ferredoxin [bacterium (Candidatus Blackallbacteria) CG13_big_fil_rev_8_21_14_2_50_49_14]